MVFCHTEALGFYFESSVWFCIWIYQVGIVSRDPCGRLHYDCIWKCIWLGSGTHPVHPCFHVMHVFHVIWFLLLVKIIVTTLSSSLGLLLSDRFASILLLFFKFNITSVGTFSFIKYKKKGTFICLDYRWRSFKIFICSYSWGIFFDSWGEK